MQEIHENSKFFKSGNSFGLRLTKSDKEKMHAQPGDEYEKDISSDGRVITFKKKESISKDTQKMIDKIFDEDSDLIDTLSFLQAQRIKQGITQTEFAKRINMTQPQLAKIENMDSTPTLATLNKYAAGLGLEIRLSISPLMEK